jgi:uncharacterized membrane protein YkoI
VALGPEQAYLTVHDEPGPVETEEQALAIAQQAIAGKITPRAGSSVQIVRRDDSWDVEWALAPEPRRGPDFEARVTIDAETGEVTSVLAGS